MKINIMILHAITILSWSILAIAGGVLFSRAVKFLLVSLLGENVNLTYVDKNGRRKKMRFRVRNNEEFLDIISKLDIQITNKAIT